MYETFYGLNEKPFSIQPDPDFLFMGKRHTLAYSMLEYSIRNKAGFAVISGEIGCGKTTLIRHLLNNLGDDVCIGLVYNTHQEIGNLLEWIMLAFGQPYAGLSPVALYESFQQFLITQYSLGKRVLLIVDEAQNLGPSALESLRMLSNINADKDQLLQMILVGQPQLKDLLRRPDLQQFVQRVSTHFFIPPLESSEVARYIEHRLRTAGRTEPLFTPEACARIAELSRGIPRIINILCDTALVYGFSGDAGEIGRDLIDEVANDQSEFGAISWFESTEPLTKSPSAKPARRT
jgi:general secretion pathway protein A